MRGIIRPTPILLLLLLLPLVPPPLSPSFVRVVRSCPTNRCRSMKPPGNADRFCLFEFQNPPIIEMRMDFWVMGLLFWGMKTPRTKSPLCSESRRSPPNRCQRMQSPGAVDRFRHFKFQNPPIIEVRMDFWVMGLLFLGM